MKYRIFLWLFLLGGLTACQEDEEVGFEVPVEFRKITFDPVPGGAVMRYKLPENMDIFGVRARYINAYGKQLVKEGTYLTDTLLLNGFNEARTNEPVRLTFYNQSLEESEPIEMTFDTKAAATVALFENLTVNPFWGGFNVTYTSPENVEGTVHVFYIGENPFTHQPDTILQGSFPISEGGDTLNFELKQKVAELNVVVRTDDYEGNRVKLKVFDKVEMMTMDTLLPEQFDFSFTGNIIENERFQFSEKYLFDGKKRGDDFRKHKLEKKQWVYSTFMAGPNAFHERFIFDLKEPKIPAALLGYVFVQFGADFPGRSWRPDWEPADPVKEEIGAIWSFHYPTRCASKAKVYGTNENPRTVDLANCTLLYKLDDDERYANWRNNSWCKNTNEPGTIPYGQSGYLNVTDSEFEAVEPVVLRMMCNYTREKYRYLILVVEDTYLSNRNPNTFPYGYEENNAEYITFDEIEVLVKAE